MSGFNHFYFHFNINIYLDYCRSPVVFRRFICTIPPFNTTPSDINFIKSMENFPLSQIIRSGGINHSHWLNRETWEMSKCVTRVCQSNWAMEDELGLCVLCQSIRLECLKNGSFWYWFGISSCIFPIEHPCNN